MGFFAAEKQQMLALKGVGETVVARLEQIGFSSLAQLAGKDPAGLTWQIAQMLGSTCWHDNPQARGAIRAIIGLAPCRARWTRSTQDARRRASAGKLPRPSGWIAQPG